MIGLVEEKKPWNLRVYESIADAFDEQVKRDHRADKGVCVTAAVMMYLTASNEFRQKFVDVIKLAEGRGIDGTMLDAAKKAISGLAEAEADRLVGGAENLAGESSGPPQARPGKKKQRA